MPSQVKEHYVADVADWGFAMAVKSGTAVPLGGVLKGSSPPSNADLKDGTWHVVYPVYLDVAKTVSGGRRVAKEHACKGFIIE